MHVVTVDRPRPRPTTLLAVAACLLTVAATCSDCLAVDQPVKLRQFIGFECADCHDAKIRKGELDLAGLPWRLEDADNLRRWVKVYDKLASGEMPPKDEPQPLPQEKRAFLDTLRGALIAAEAQHAPTHVRRLNRLEYEHTLRDLLSLPLLRVKGTLPEDGKQHGFDKVAGALEVSHIQMRKYLDVADRALREAVVTQADAPQTTKWRGAAAEQWSGRSAIATHNAVPINGRQLAPGLTTHVRGNPRDDPGNTYRAASFNSEAESLAILSGVMGAHQPQGLQIDRFKPTVPGFYRVRFSVWGLRWNRTKAEAAIPGVIRNYTVFDNHDKAFKNEQGKWEMKPLPEDQWRISETKENIEFYGDKAVTHVVRASLKGEPIGFYDAPSLEPTTHEFTIWLNPDDRISFHAMTLPARGPRNAPSSDGAVTYEGPGVSFDWFEVEGPLVEQWPPASQRVLFGDGVKQPGRDDVRDLLRAFADRAFRRPVDANEVEPYASIVHAQLEQGESFEEAMLTGYRALLCSPDFLFIGLEDGVGDSGDTRYALASRLSYFLWNSMPDDTLRQLAASGELAKPQVLREQVDRMLADPRSERFVEHFLDQWLEMEKIDFTTPDPQLYPEFDAWLRDSMLAETRAYLRKMLDENLGVGHVIDADFVLINQRLAELYDIKGVTGAKLRAVELAGDSPRGGLLTQASVLKVTANGTATSPVLRGVWVTERILGMHPDPPPPNIPAIEPDATGATTVREMIEMHRADPACASCHAKIDPPGMALESFDVIGGWRDRYRLAGRPGKIKVNGKKVPEPTIEVIANNGRRMKLRLGPEVDASGELTDGRAFDDVNGLKARLLNDRPQLARNVAQQLLIYATGAGVRFSDRAELDAIVERTRDGGYGLRSILHEVVQSRVFLSAGSPRAVTERR